MYQRRREVSFENGSMQILCPAAPHTFNKVDEMLVLDGHVLFWPWLLGRAKKRLI